MIGMKDGVILRRRLVEVAARLASDELLHLALLVLAHGLFWRADHRRAPVVNRDTLALLTLHVDDVVALGERLLLVVRLLDNIVLAGIVLE